MTKHLNPGADGEQESEIEMKFRHIEELRAEFVDKMGISEEDADKWLQIHRDEAQALADQSP